MDFNNRGGRLSGKRIIVTGSARGFGEGIASALLEHGCRMVFTDLNIEQAEKNAVAANAKYGEGAAIAVYCDVTDEGSVENLLEETVSAFGGLDTFISNAGILISGSLEELKLEEFELVTKINYTSFFICVKHASRLMKRQREAEPSASFDIIQINSKSGLEGSNKNFAYAGGKFGGIGLVQSFAKELVEYGIKVNAVCPGNFYEGPLWSDSENGLFVQYLRAGNVPGAKDIADVKNFYLSKVPMKRGCYPKDVARAILYCIEQEYETGQAIPVTGGQNMLK
jgi:NAD(P)-dependent dehydrogenase (short-subunit alcohol dehydrogenase family)